MAMRDKEYEPGLPYLLARAHRSTNLGLDRILKRENLSVEQWRVLQALKDGQGCTMSELSERALLTMSALSKNADRMVSRALIMRQRDAIDHRRVLVRLTDFGRDLLTRCDTAVSGFEQDMTSHLSDQDRAELARLLTAVSSQDGSSGRA